MPPLSTDGSDDSQAVAKAFNDYAGVRSYLSRDTDGRVVRIDTFSKVYGPGIRSVRRASSAISAPRRES
jgi:DNA-binding transcriptional MocR family regulator